MKRGDLPAGVDPDDIYRPGDDAFEPYTEDDAIQDELRKRQMKLEVED